MKIVKFIKRKIYVITLLLKEGGVKKLLYFLLNYRRLKREQKARDGVNANERVAVDSEYQDNISFADNTTDVKMLAFHLPQYHTFPENDKWWGKGFTEWNNVRKGDARFDGHYQPRVPHSDIGYYDLSKVETLAKQVSLAKEHGIYGFCFYYYWFSGKRLMEKPVDMLLEHTEIDFPFCLCWANENWTRAWDGQNKDVLIAQDYSDEDDERFILDLKKYIDDSRYIRINGKPLIVVYNPGQIPDCNKSFKKWRKVARECGIGEILIWTCMTANNSAEKLGIFDCIDAEVEFPPHNYWQEELAVRNVDLKGKSAFLYSYDRLVDYIIKNIDDDGSNRKVPLHRCCMMAWDNAARRQDAWFTYTGFSLKSLYKWVLSIADKARQDFEEEERFIFINAWNEWGEGTYLEPDEKYGYANINTVSKALFGKTLNDDLIVINDSDEVMAGSGFETKRIAVQIHMFYLDTLDETIEYLNNIPYKFDCYFSTDTEDKKKYIEEKVIADCNAENCIVEIYDNRGRDVAPFIMQMRKYFSNYDYICHIHSKKTKTNEHGNEWRKYIFRHLLGGEKYLKKVFEIFDDNPTIGILMPETYPVLELQAEWGGNKEGVAELLEKLGIEASLPNDPVFPVGNMFWFRSAACEKIFNSELQQADFPEEAGQVNATLAHQIERCWLYLIKNEGYTYKKIFNNCSDSGVVDLSSKKRIVLYVHYDKDNELKECDLNTVKEFSKICGKTVFITNSKINADETNKIQKYANELITRENIGFDFGAWKEAILKLGRDEISQYDELILLNNSCFAPVFNIKEMFSEMEGRSLDFWGDTLFPFIPDGSYIGESCIDEHLQSYLMVFNKSVINSEKFWDFWEEMPICKEFIEVVAKCESKLTKYLSDNGFSYEPYIRETYYINSFLNNYAIPYEKPTSLLLLRDPFVKKKCYQYMDVEEKVKLEYLLNQVKR